MSALPCLSAKLDSIPFVILGVCVCANVADISHLMLSAYAIAY